jgi:drug/metabolite transporter (DMT)-like permease
MSDTLRGAALMTFAMLFFAIEDAFIKWVSASISVGFIIAFIGIVGFVIFAAIARAQGHALWSPHMASWPIALRIGGEAFGTLCFVSAIAFTPLATATAIFQASPLVVTLGAALFLAAPVGWRRWTAILVGFFGVLLIIRPGAESFDPYSLFSVGAVIGLSVRDLATRAVPAKVPSIVLAVHGLLAVVPVGIVLMLWSGTGTLPTGGAAIGLLLAAFAGVSGYYAIVAAMRLGDVAVVTSFRYTRLLFGLLIAVVIFGERPDMWTLIGAAIVLGSGLYTLMREARMHRAAA